MSDLQREQAAFKRHLPELLVTSQGKHALIIGDDVVETFGSYEDALKAGYRLAGLGAFLVRRISGADTIAFFTRDVGLSCPA